jgi:hypothetical protein
MIFLKFYVSLKSIQIKSLFCNPPLQFEKCSLSFELDNRVKVEVDFPGNYELSPRS